MFADQVWSWRPAGKSASPPASVAWVLSALRTWQPERYRRILILAPHPDDEVLAGGGAIATALAAAHPPQVQVVVATGGDASYSAIWLNGHNPVSRRTFRRLGVERQRESLNALTSLGLSPAQVRFWGFPDRGLTLIWRCHWTEGAPYRSRTTGLTAAVQTVNGLAVPYTGAGLLSLLRRMLADYQPDALIMPHPRDAHPDHRALARFTALAVALNQAEGFSPAPDLLAYVVWLHGTPWSAPLRVGRDILRLPAHLAADTTPWLPLPLTPAAMEQKAISLQCYRSQARPLRDLLRRRADEGNEIFASLRPCRYLWPVAELPPTPDASWQTWPYEEDRWSTVLSPITAPAAPVALWGVTDRRELRLAAQLSHPPRKGLDYMFVVRTVTGCQLIEVRAPAREFIETANEGIWAIARLSLAPLPTGADDPDRVLVAALESHLGHRIVVARSAWQLLYVAKGNFV